MTKYKTREAWLAAFAKAAKPQFKKLKLEYPADLRIGCGWLGKKYAGRTYWPETSSVGASEVTLNLSRDQMTAVAGTLVHELIHACGVTNHKADFVAYGRALGLGGKPTAMGWDDTEPPVWADKIFARLGDYPTGTLDPSTIKKETTRLIKAECGDCGLIFRITRKYMNRNLRCPDHDCGGELTIG